MPNGTEELYFYGASGQKLGTFRPAAYTSPASLLLQVVDLNLSFGSRTIVSRNARLALDPLRSDRTGGIGYCPYGEEQGAGTPNDRDKFGTYYGMQPRGWICRNNSRARAERDSTWAELLQAFRHDCSRAI